MSRDWRRSVEQVLNRGLFSAPVIPRDGAVDSNLFSEDEFPIYCPKCSYLLRGLPDGRCPECGTFFERERLLVQQYVFQDGEPAWRSTRTGKWVRRMMIAGSLLVLLLSGVGYGVHELARSRVTPTSASAAADAILRSWFLPLLVLMSILGMLLLVGAVMCVRQFYLNSTKRRRILDALQNAEE